MLSRKINLTFRLRYSKIFSVNLTGGKYDYSI